jgi:hypothetical protein
MSVPPPGYRSRLITTREEDVPRDVALRFREVCAAASAVDAGFACRQRITIGADLHDERLGLAVHMALGSRDEQTEVLRGFAQAFPGEGLAFLEDVAVRAWRRLAD